MIRRTRKWKFYEQEAQRLADLGLSPADIAVRLEVNKSTVTRWIAAGKLKVPTKVVSITVAVARMSPAEWAKAIREEYALSPTDEQLVTLGEAALSLSRDITAKASVQLNAGARFLAIAKHLDVLPRKDAAKEQEQPKAVNDTPAAPARTANPPVRRRSKADPRDSFMRVVK